MVVQYKNQSVETLLYQPITQSEQLQLKQQFFQRPQFSDVIKQFKKINENGVMVDKIIRYYFRDIMAKTKLKGCKWTVEDVFDSPDLLGIFKAKTKTNTYVYDSNKLITNIETAIRLGGSGIAKFPPNFPIKTARAIVQKYNINNNWYDFSCGWGVRLLTAISKSINYFGTDPNYLLTQRLLQLYSDYNTNIKTNSIVDIRTHGSEIFIPEWENKIGLAFSSPPYFDLEDYVIGKQSYNTNTSYDDWKNNYLYPTLQNIYRYLINDGILAFNIKNGKTHMLADDTKSLATQCGFWLADIELLTNNQRVTSSGPINNAENVFIFKKVEKHVSVPVSPPVTENIIAWQKEIIEKPTKEETSTENNLNCLKKLDIYLIGVKSKKQLNDISIYNSENKFLGEKYFATVSNEILKKIKFLSTYELGKYVEATKQNIIDLLNYMCYHKDCNNGFKTVVKLCEIIDAWDDMESNNFHIFLQIENN